MICRSNTATPRLLGQRPGRRRGDPGGTVSADGIAYTWPNEPPGTNDSIEASGQTIPAPVGSEGGSAAVQPGKTVASVTLPNPTNGYIGLFAISGA